MWDIEDGYPFEKIIDPVDIETSSRKSDDTFFFELKIPIEGLSANGEIGFRANFDSYRTNIARSTVGEDYEFYYFSLRR